MMTNRDKAMLKFIEDYGSLTIRQASELFFDGIYESARRRLKYYYDNGRLKYVISDYNKEKIYYDNESKKLTTHYLFVLDYIAYLHSKGCEIKKLILHPYYYNNKLIPDAFVSFVYNGYLYMTLVEIDYSHYTDNTKFKKYEAFANDKSSYPKEFEELDGDFPAIVIARTSPGLHYSSKYLELIFTNLNFDKIDTFLLN